MYTLKLVQETDVQKLAEIFAKSFSVADPEKPWDVDHARQYLEYWMKKQPDMFFGAYDENNNPVGAMAVNIKPWRTGVRCNDGVVFVDVEHQKKGIATLLFRKVIEEAKQKYGATSFEAVTFAAKQFPLTWYEQIGITPDEHAVLITGKSDDILNKLSA